MEKNSNRLILSREFNSTINWVTREAGGEGILEFDLIFTRQENEIEEIKYSPPFEKSDHVLVYLILSPHIIYMIRQITIKRA